MSRIGKAPIEVPDKVEVKVDGQKVTVKGPKGELIREIRPEIEIKMDGKVITVFPRNPNDRLSRGLHGLSRTLIANMVLGVDQGFTKQLEMVGVGYKGVMQGKTLVLSLGFSHPVEIVPPAGVELSVEKNTVLLIKGPDKEVVGQVAANIRTFRKPEPYKGKGIKYAGEKIRRKAGKSGKK